MWQQTSKMVSLLCWTVYERVVWGVDELAVAVLVLLPEIHAASSEYLLKLNSENIVYLSGL